MDPVSFAFACIGFVQTVLQAYSLVEDKIQTYRAFERNRDELRTLFLAEKSVTLKLRDLLFARKASQSQKSLFELLDLHVQHSISAMFALFSKGIGEYLPLEKQYKLDLKPAGGLPLLSHDLSALVLAKANNFQSERTHGLEWSAGILGKWKWTLRDKKRLLELLSEFDMWNKKIKQMVEVHFLAEIGTRLNSDIPSSFRTDTDFRSLKITNALDARQIALIDTEHTPGNPHNDTSELRWAELEVNARVNNVELGSYTGTKVIIDSKIDDETSTPRRRPNAVPRLEQLAALLKSLYDNEIPLAKCIGWVDRQDRGVFSLLFEFPHGLQSKPVSLLDSLPPKFVTSGPPLEERYRLAYKVSSTMSKLWSVGWIHKNLRSENILFFHEAVASATDKKADSPILPRCFLFGFEYARSLSSDSSLRSDENIKHNIYRHPERWGVPTTKFEPMHDVYALGVVLLELGLWRQAISLEPSGFSHATNPFAVQTHLVGRARTHLPFLTSSAYADAVLACLTGNFKLDPDETFMRIDNLVSRFRILIEEELRVLAFPTLSGGRRLPVELEDSSGEQ